MYNLIILILVWR